MRVKILAAIGLVLALAAIAIATTDGSSWRTEFLPAGGIYKASPSTLADGEQDTLRLTTAGLLRVSVAANVAGTTVQEVVGDVADGIATAGNPVLIGGQDGTLTQSIKTDSGGELQVDVLTAAISGDVAHDAADSGSPVKIGGIGRATVEAAASTAADRVNASFTLEGRLRTEDASGYVAHDAADAGNPIKIGGKGSAAVAAAVTEGDRVNASFTLTGRQRSEAVGVARSVSGTASIAADNVMLPATANARLFSLFICESAATPAAASCAIRHGTLATDTILATINLAANGDKFISFGDGGVPIASGLFLDRVGGEFSATAVYGVAD